MKKFLLLLVILAGGVFMGYSQKMAVMTYNIRFDNPKDYGDNWNNRKKWLVDQLAFYEPGIFGIQEGLVHQVDYLDRYLTEYEYIGVGRDDGGDQGEFSAVYYDTTQFNVLRNSTFWLSETPAEVSVGWDAALERICTWGLFEHKASNKKFWVFNTHFDHVGDTARKKSARLIVDKIHALNDVGHPVVLMGDFNLEPDSDGIQFLSNHFRDAKKYSSIVNVGPEGTYNGFDYSRPATRRIDYIFVSENVHVKKYGVLSDPVDGRYPSDHFPVYVTLEIKGH